MSSTFALTYQIILPNNCEYNLACLETQCNSGFLFEPGGAWTHTKNWPNFKLKKKIILEGEETDINVQKKKNHCQKIENWETKAWNIVSYSLDKTYSLSSVIPNSSNSNVRY